MAVKRSPYEAVGLEGLDGTSSFSASLFPCFPVSSSPAPTRDAYPFRGGRGALRGCASMLRADRDGAAGDGASISQTCVRSGTRMCGRSIFDLLGSEFWSSYIAS